jgi:cytochrome c553
MFKSVVSTLFGAVAIVAVIAVPADAAEEVEAKLQVCGACHGQNGEPFDATIPIIWGQQQSYLVKQLHDYKSRDRDNPIMSPMADTIKQEELRKAAAYFASKSWPARHAAAVAAASASPPNGIAICRACHQQNFEGGPPAPRLAGLSYEYLVGAMRSFADDERTNNLDMPKLMKALTESEREAIARYLSGL